MLVSIAPCGDGEHDRDTWQCPAKRSSNPAASSGLVHRPEGSSELHPDTDTISNFLLKRKKKGLEGFWSETETPAKDLQGH